MKKLLILYRLFMSVNQAKINLNPVNSLDKLRSIWYSRNLMKKNLQNLVQQRHKNTINRKKRNSFASFIKSHQKSSVSQTRKKYALNALFLDNIKAMNLKALNKQKNKEINVTSKFFKFSRKKNKPNNVCATRRHNRALLKFLTERGTFLKNKSEISSES